jgi:hypothetical protein
MISDYILCQSEYIKKNKQDIILHIQQAHQTFEKMFPSADSTWSYNRYNIFSLAGPSSVFHKIFKELQNLIASQLGTDKELWIQSWVNYMPYQELTRLDWHGHSFDYHGYISIDPKNTRTEFENYVIENGPGQIYMGPGNRKHKVVSDQPYDGTRITIGFDVVVTDNTGPVRYTQIPWNNLSFIPL